ncbi:response regulator [Singulisphaera sp. PoT]|uniref:response regulator n=1 Tax=Singulisphaera sp. PoT TaxID=3411797 RepID=UPI003BF52890
MPNSVLVVEDHDLTRRTLVALFRGHGWPVRAAATLKEALAQLEPAPATILLDLMLSDGDGEEVLRQVRSSRLPSRVVVMTGMADRERLDRLRELKPDSILRKPINFSNILRKCLVE